jgi:ankyrin repeat protein
VVTALAEEGADKDAKNKKGWTAMMIAAQNGHE